MSLKILKNTLNYIGFKELKNIDSDIYYINNNMIDNVKNEKSIEIFNLLSNDINILCEYYYKYQKKIIRIVLYIIDKNRL